MSSRPLLAPAKRAVLKAVQATGGFVLFRVANAGNGLVLMYHRFSEAAGDEVISRQQFVAHLRYLTVRYKVVSIPELAAGLSARAAPERPLVAITIDDGHADAYDIAFPVLKQFGVPATLFVVTGFLDGVCWIWTDRVIYLFGCTRRTRLSVQLGPEQLQLQFDDAATRSAVAALVIERLKRLPEAQKNSALDRLAVALDVDVPVKPPPGYAPVSWRQVHELERHGVKIEAHTVTHPILTNVTSDQLTRELTESKARLERELGRPIRTFCYPNGDCSQAVRDAVLRAGYTHAVLSAGGLNAPRADPLCLRRIGAEADLVRFAKTTSGFDSWQMNLWSRSGAPVK